MFRVQLLTNSVKTNRLTRLLSMTCVLFLTAKSKTFSAMSPMRMTRSSEPRAKPVCKHCLSNHNGLGICFIYSFDLPKIRSVCFENEIPGNSNFQGNAKFIYMF